MKVNLSWTMLVIAVAIASPTTPTLGLGSVSSTYVGTYSSLNVCEEERKLTEARLKAQAATASPQGPSVGTTFLCVRKT